MPPDTAKLLHDMKSASERIGRFVAGKTFPDYTGDELLRSGVERQFEIIGEAMSRLLKIDPETAKKITDYRKIAGFRNALIHGYDSIDDVIAGALSRISCRCFNGKWKDCFSRDYREVGMADHLQAFALSHPSA
jgi:uncharacterized protein with HEPN domain